MNGSRAFYPQTRCCDAAAAAAVAHDAAAVGRDDDIDDHNAVGGVTTNNPTPEPSHVTQLVSLSVRDAYGLQLASLVIEGKP